MPLNSRVVSTVNRTGASELGASVNVGDKVGLDVGANKAVGTGKGIGDGTSDDGADVGAGVVGRDVGMDDGTGVGAGVGSYEGCPTHVLLMQKSERQSPFTSQFLPISHPRQYRPPQSTSVSVLLVSSLSFMQSGVVGVGVGCADGAGVGAGVGVPLGYDVDGCGVGVCVGNCVGLGVGEKVSTLTESASTFAMLRRRRPRFSNSWSNSASVRSVASRRRRANCWISAVKLPEETDFSMIFLI